MLRAEKTQNMNVKAKWRVALNARSWTVQKTCVTSNVLRVLTTSAPSIKRHIYSFMYLSHLAPTFMNTGNEALDRRNEMEMRLDARREMEWLVRNSNNVQVGGSLRCGNVQSLLPSINPSCQLLLFYLINVST